MDKNPGEGRLTEEGKAERLREARKRTRDMKRQYKLMRRETRAKDRADAWAKRHSSKHDDLLHDMRIASAGGNSLNRVGRRRFAKLLNVYKGGEGWKHFNEGYRKKYGLREPNGKTAPKVIKNNITQALEAAKVEKD